MKILPCDTCESGVATLPGGAPYTLGRSPEKGGTLIKCATCKRKTRVTVQRYNALPTLTLEGMKAHGIEGLALDDLVGAGLTREQAEQAVDGAPLEDLHRER